MKDILSYPLPYADEGVVVRCTGVKDASVDKGYNLNHNPGHPAIYLLVKEHTSISCPYCSCVFEYKKPEESIASS